MTMSRVAHVWTMGRKVAKFERKVVCFCSECMQTNLKLLKEAKPPLKQYHHVQEKDRWDVWNKIALTTFYANQLSPLNLRITF